MTKVEGVIFPEMEYQQFLAVGRFMIQRSRSDGGYVFYPRVVAPRTGASDLEWVEASGHATVYSTTIISDKSSTARYNVSLVTLKEGPRVMSRVVGIEPEQVRIGMAVKARIVREEGEPLLLFEPA
jgi:uncharacterized OB-fold protein